MYLSVFRCGIKSFNHRLVGSLSSVTLLALLSIMTSLKLFHFPDNGISLITLMPILIYP